MEGLISRQVEEIHKDPERGDTIGKELMEVWETGSEECKRKAMTLKRKVLYKRPWMEGSKSVWKSCVISILF